MRDHADECDELPEGVFIAGPHLSEPDRLVIMDGSGVYLKMVTEPDEFDDDLERCEYVARMLTHHGELVELLATMIGYAQADHLDDKSNLWRSAMIDANALFKTLNT